jgi:hypothetical protein|tara:strand:+ start:4763 stop:4951 length:189 start_codon:yes stop_codon:yes gene_type:complete
MKIHLTKGQLEKVGKEKREEEIRLSTIPKSGHGWDIVYCENNIHALTEILKNKQIDVYRDLN